MSFGNPVERTVVAVDLSRYSEIARHAEQQLGAGAVAGIHDQITTLVKAALGEVQANVTETMIKSTGDGLLILFEKALSADRFAVALHRLAEDYNRDKAALDRRRFRVGIASGNVVLDDQGMIAGLPPAIATQLESAANTGEVVTESSTWQALPIEEREQYGSKEVVSGKQGERFFAHRRQVPELATRPSDAAAEIYIRSLEIENVKVVRRARLEFAETMGEAPGWFVLAGGNGSGKSTLLRAIAAASVRSLGRLLDDSWIRSGFEDGRVTVTYVDGSKSAEAPRAQLRIKRSSILDLGYSCENEAHEKLEGSYIAGYGPFKRLAGGSDHARNLSGKDSRMARLITLFLEEAALWEVSEWLLKTAFDPNGEDFKRGVISLLSSGLLPDRFFVERFAEGDLILSTPDGFSISLRDTSDGLRCMVAMVLDILRGLEDCYGEVDLSGGQVSQPGIVLIDEPDNHLHVLWQMRLASWMKKHFPRIQFIVASHSPFICVAVDKIWRLDDESGAVVPRVLSDEEMREVWNGSLAAILESDAFRVFNTLRPETQDRHMEYLTLRQLSLQGRRLSPVEQNRLAELEEQILGPAIPPDPEFDKLFS